MPAPTSDLLPNSRSLLAVLGLVGRLFGRLGRGHFTFTDCAKERMYDIKITVDGSKVTWSDADGACDELVLQDAIGSSSEGLYVYVGGGFYYSAATWYSVEICPWSFTTASPTASPSLASPGWCGRSHRAELAPLEPEHVVAELEVPEEHLAEHKF